MSELQRHIFGYVHHRLTKSSPHSNAPASETSFKMAIEAICLQKKRLTHQLEPVTLQRRTFANTKNTPTVRRCLSSAIGSLGVLESQPRSYNFSREVRESDLNQYSKHQVIPQNPSFRFYFRSLADQKPCVFLEV